MNKIIPVDDVVEKPRMTSDFVEKLIGHTAFQLLPDGRSTVCQITLVNGFTLSGISSFIDTGNYDEEVGRSRAYEKAMQKVRDAAALLFAEQQYEIGKIQSIDARNLLRGIGFYFKHYTGSIYKLLHTAKNKSDLTETAVYQSVADGEIYTRPLDQFYEKFTCVFDLPASEAFLIGLQGEHDEVMLKHSKLGKLVCNPKPDHFTDENWQLCCDQFKHMTNYADVLLARMQLLAQKKESSNA